MKRVRVAIDVMSRLAGHESAEGRPWRPVARFARWQLRKRLLKDPVVIDAFDGARLKCWPDCTATSAVMYLEWPDWHEMKLLARLLRPGDTFLDVGANVGIYSALAAPRVLPGGRVIAFEPDPTNLARLRETFALNGLAAGDVHGVALGAEDGSVRFTVGRDCVGHVATDAEDGVDVPLRRLDDLVEPEDSVVFGKIDVEGFEMSVFAGASKLLAARRPRCWLLETNETASRYGSTRHELHQLLIRHGYGLFQVADEGARLVEVALGGPYPLNSLAVSDLDWLRERLGSVQVA